MQTSTISNRTERVTVEGVELIVTINTVNCADGITRDIADPFVQVDDRGCKIALALSSKTVSKQGVQDAIMIAMMPNRDCDSI